jgi:hypothetical protein
MLDIGKPAAIGVKDSLDGGRYVLGGLRDGPAGMVTELPDNDHRVGVIVGLPGPDMRDGPVRTAVRQYHIMDLPPHHRSAPRSYLLALHLGIRPVRILTQCQNIATYCWQRVVTDRVVSRRGSRAVLASGAIRHASA